MIANAILHDRRLTGRPPGSTQGFRLYRTNGNISLNWTLSHIAGDARGHGGIGELHIMCHGLEDIVAVNNQSQVRGGFGLELGREGVDLSNVAVFSALAGLVQIITIHACATADTVPGVSNGRQLCREIAARTRAPHPGVHLLYRRQRPDRFWGLGRARVPVQPRRQRDAPFCLKTHFLFFLKPNILPVAGPLSVAQGHQFTTRDCLLGWAT